MYIVAPFLALIGAAFAKLALLPEQLEGSTVYTRDHVRGELSLLQPRAYASDTSDGFDG